MLPSWGTGRNFPPPLAPAFRVGGSTWLVFTANNIVRRQVCCPRDRHVHLPRLLLQGLSFSGDLAKEPNPSARSPSPWDMNSALLWLWGQAFGFPTEEATAGEVEDCPDPDVNWV